MKSRSRKLPAVSPLDLVPELRQEVLLLLAEKLGPGLDQVDPAMPTVVVEREFVQQLVEAGRARPVQVRVALADLVTLGCIAFDEQGHLHLRPHGLVLARMIEPEVGMPMRASFELAKEEHDLSGVLSFGEPGKDQKSLRGGVRLACFLLFHVRGLSCADPLSLGDVARLLQVLARIGIGPKSGKGARIKTSKDTIAEALDDLKRWRLLRLATSHDEADRRSRRYWNEGPLPEVTFSKWASRSDPRSWQQYIATIRSVFDAPPPSADGPSGNTAVSTSPN